jgi:hypothetical protein
MTEIEEAAALCQAAGLLEFLAVDGALPADRAQAVLRLLNASHPTVPPDWMLAPREPSEAMMAAAESLIKARKAGDQPTRTIYKAMLGAIVK